MGGEDHGEVWRWQKESEVRERCKTGERQESQGEQERKKERVSADGHAVCDADDT